MLLLRKMLKLHTQKIKALLFRLQADSVGSSVGREEEQDGSQEVAEDNGS